MISLRISEEEYESLKHFATQFGARNISDFARIALHRMIKQLPAAQTNGNNGTNGNHHTPTPNSVTTMESRLHEFDGRLRAMESRIQEFALTAKK
jgi:hypothetical protein